MGKYTNNQSLDVNKSRKLVGSDPDQIPTNAHLGTMAYQQTAGPMGSYTNPAMSGVGLYNYNPYLPAGVYWFINNLGLMQQLYCDVPNGGWILASSNSLDDRTANDINRESNIAIPGGTSRRSTKFFLNRQGSDGNVIGYPDPNREYMIGGFIDDMNFSEARIFGWGWNDSANTSATYSNPSNLLEATWSLPGTTYATNKSSITPVADVTITTSYTASTGGNGYNTSANYFIIDGIFMDYNVSGFDANANQTTIGAAGVGSANGDPRNGTLIGHGASEGSYEGWYDGAVGAKDSRGYTTWFK